MEKLRKIREMKHLVVLGSGNGSNFAAIVEFFQDKIKYQKLRITCISDKSDSKILERAKNYGIDNYIIPFNQTYDFLKSLDSDLFVLAGYMRIISHKILSLGTFINIHPSLLPSFKGMNAIKDAYNYGVKITGVTIHYVNEEVDSGEIIAQEALSIGNMDINELTEAIHKIEHRIYPQVISRILYS